MIKAPREIFLISDELEGLDWDNPERIHWADSQVDADCIGYIRKDVYDLAQARIRGLEDTIQDGKIEAPKDEIIDLKARIRELEDTIKQSLLCGWHAMEGSLGFKGVARNALKESEG